MLRFVCGSLSCIRHIHDSRCFMTRAGLQHSGKDPLDWFSMCWLSWFSGSGCCSSPGFHLRLGASDCCLELAFCFMGPWTFAWICCPATPLPPVQKRDAQHKFYYSTDGHAPKHIGLAKPRFRYIRFFIFLPPNLSLCVSLSVFLSLLSRKKKAHKLLAHKLFEKVARQEALKGDILKGDIWKWDFALKFALDKWISHRNSHSTCQFSLLFLRQFHRESTM